MMEEIFQFLGEHYLAILTSIVPLVVSIFIFRLNGYLKRQSKELEKIYYEREALAKKIKQLETTLSESLMSELTKSGLSKEEIAELLDKGLSITELKKLIVHD